MNFLKQIAATLIGVIIAGVLFFVGLLIVIGIIVAGVSKKEPVTVKSNSILMLTLDKPIKDKGTDNPFSSIDIAGLNAEREIGLNEVLKSIEAAKSDKNISGIYLKLSTLQAGISTTEEIRNALLGFKKSGKFIIAYADIYTQKTYYLATVADKIYMNPEGELLFGGLSSEILFYKGTLEKLNIDVQIFKHGKYKSAVETFCNDKMSPESKEQTTAFLNSIWNHMLDTISSSRGISKLELNRYADNMLIKNAEESVRYNMIDSAIYKDQLIDILASLSHSKKEDLPLTTLSSYFKTITTSNTSKNKIAVIYAQGSINMSGENDGENISAEKLSVTIRQARTDSSVKAIVFRVNSPGGSALASEVIWREVYLASKVKPVITSMGDLAASGGYYIAAPSTIIVADPVTITGSIGVFGLIPNIQGFMNKKLGITTDRVKTNLHSDIQSMMRPLSAEEKQVIQAEIERIYKTFITHVSDGRKLRLSAVDSMAQGRVWAGNDALKLGLVDTIGGITTAIRIAAKQANLPNYTIEELPESESKWMQLLNELTGETKLRWIKNEMGEFYPVYKNIMQIKYLEGMQMRLPYIINLY